jgi:hypothetical protein
LGKAAFVIRDGYDIDTAQSEGRDSITDVIQDAKGVLEYDHANVALYDTRMNSLAVSFCCRKHPSARLRLDRIGKITVVINPTEFILLLALIIAGSPCWVNCSVKP